MSVNKVMLIGRLGGDPDIRTFDDGGKIATVSIATSDKWTDKQTGEKRETTEWHRVVFSNHLADIAGEYLKKGSQIYVEGAIKTRKWTDKQGIERTITEIRAVSLQMLGGGQGQGYQQGQPQPTYPQGQPPRKIGGGFKEMEAMGKQIRDDEMPF